MDDMSIYLDSIVYHERYIRMVMDILQKYTFRLND
jgi:hypothetical protein